MYKSPMKVGLFFGVKALKTDDGTKRSAKGLLAVHDNNGVLELKDECTKEQMDAGLLEVVFENGKLVKDQSLAEIRHTLNQHLEKTAAQYA